MRIILIGKNGQLGWELCRTLPPIGELITIDFPEIDLTSEKNVETIVLQSKPELIINAAAFTDVDRAELDPDQAMAVNGTAPGILADIAARINASLIHFSTDYVFSGKKNQPYVETDSPGPLNEYGRSKLAGEQSIQASQAAYLIFRTSWVYSTRRDNFVKKVLSWAKARSTIKIVDDQTGNPTWARTLAQLTAMVILSGRMNSRDWIEQKQGIYHLAGKGAATRFEWAQSILEAYPVPENHTPTEVLPAKTSDFPTPAIRPVFTALNCQKFEDAFGLRIPDWRSSLFLALNSFSPV